MPRHHALAAKVLGLVLLLGAAGCQSGPSGGYKRAINSLLAAQNFAGAQAALEKAKESQYGKKNQVLYYLDLGTVLHHAGKYQESDDAFDKAEQRMVDLYTKSVTQAAGLLVLNDGTMDYAGEPFERALTNVYRALDWVFLGKLEEAVVEARKAGVFLDELNRTLDGKARYKDDAFAQYLSALLYADAGKLDDARICMEKAMAAYDWYAADYGVAAPRFEFPSEDRKSARGELVFIHLNGNAPVKVSKTFQVAWNQALVAVRESGEETAQFKNGLTAGIAGRAVTVSYPEYQPQPFRVRASQVRVDEAPAVPTLLVEDVQAIAAKTLQDRMALIKTRSIARAMVKYVLAEAAARAAAKACDRIPNAFAKLACKAASRGVAHGAAAASEIADTRCWGTLPAQIRMARLKLPVGKHKVQVDFQDQAGATVETKLFENVEINKGKRTYLTYRTADALAAPASAGPAMAVNRKK
ncbi:MAG: hypothetical protein PHF00_09920 [Elusimicrobia bacterium]|nr:hypothetical protein [Elusimicrobiota bacterium]